MKICRPHNLGLGLLRRLLGIDTVFRPHPRHRSHPRHCSHPRHHSHRVLRRHRIVPSLTCVGVVMLIWTVIWILIWTVILILSATDVAIVKRNCDDANGTMAAAFANWNYGVNYAVNYAVH